MFFELEPVCQKVRSRVSSRPEASSRRLCSRTVAAVHRAPISVRQSDLVAQARLAQEGGFQGQRFPGAGAFRGGTQGPVEVDGVVDVVVEVDVAGLGPVRGPAGLRVRRRQGSEVVRDHALGVAGEHGQVRVEARRPPRFHVHHGPGAGGAQDLAARFVAAAGIRARRTGGAAPTARWRYARFARPRERRLILTCRRASTQVSPLACRSRTPTPSISAWRPAVSIISSSTASSRRAGLSFSPAAGMVNVSLKGMASIGLEL